MNDQTFGFTITPSTEIEIPTLVLETNEGTLAEAQAICEEYDCKIALSDAAGFERGWVKRGDYRLTGAQGGPERRHLAAPEGRTDA